MSARTAFRGPAKRSDLVDSLVKAFSGFEPTADREAIKLAVDAVLVLYFGAGSIISIADIGADLFDFSVGTSLAELIRPLITRRIILPTEDVLKKVFRFRAPNARLVVSMLEAGELDEQQVDAMLIDDEVKDDYLPLVKAFALGRAKQAKVKILDQVNEQLVAKAQVAGALQISRSEALITKLEADLDALEVEITTIREQRAIGAMEKQATRIETLANTVEFGEGAAAAKALTSLQAILSR